MRADTAPEVAVIPIPHLRAAWADPAGYERQRREGQAQIDALFAPHDARERAKQEARWALEGEAA